VATGGNAMKAKLVGVIAAVAMWGSSAATAATITYAVPGIAYSTNIYMTGGTITTDGTIGTLASSDIVSWSFTTIGDGDILYTITGTSTGDPFTTSQSALSATSTELIFNFSSTTANRLLFVPEPDIVASISFSPLAQNSTTCELNPASGCIQLGTGLVGYAIPESGSQVIASVASTPVPGALPLFASGLGVVGYLAKRRKRSAKQAPAAA
jgi:hypothetical protein